MKTDWTVVIVVKIIFTRPEKFDRNADLLGDRRGFEHVVVGEASSESPAGAAKMNGDVAGGNFQNVGYLLPTSFWRLAWRPELKLAVRKMRDTILRFERRMRDKWIGVGSFDNFRGGAQCRISLTVGAEREDRRLLGKIFGALREACAALLCSRAFVPLHAKFFSRRLCLPPAVRHNCDSAVKAQQFRRSLHHKSLAHTRLRLDFVKIRRADLPRKNWALFVDRVKHPGHFEVDTVRKFALHNGRVVHAGNRLANDFVILGILGLRGL